MEPIMKRLTELRITCSNWTYIKEAPDAPSLLRALRDIKYHFPD